MADADVARSRAALGRLVDPAATAFDDEVEIAPDDRADEVSLRLSELFARRPELTAVMIRLGGAEVGVATVSRLRAAAGQANVALSSTNLAMAELSMGDRATLPGLSGQYRLIHFTCAEASCSAAQVRSFYDPRTVLVCPVAGHGPMELVR
jgi:hypothetical protein